MSPAAKVRILVVDDSAVIRRLLTDILSAEEDLEVVGVASNGVIALAKLANAPPDLITLDVEMPELSGLDTLVQVRKLYPTLPVIMFSALTEKSAATTLDALARGATDYVTKPSFTGTKEASVAHVRAQLLPKIRSLALRGAAPQSPKPKGHEAPVALASAAGLARVEVLAVAASTGGPNALAKFFSAIPKDFPVPVVIVQHMPPVFTKLFADRLRSTCALTFHEARGGEALLPGHAYVAPGDFHMRVVREGAALSLALDQGPPENSCRPAADVLFRSVVEAFGAGTLAVVFTGMGQDGLKGCEKVRAAGGQVVVQDEASAVVWGMPGFVARAGLAHAVLPLDSIAAEVRARVEQRRARPPRPAQEVSDVR
jgi:two-component system chemotaxis response regulator CheB